MYLQEQMDVYVCICLQCSSLVPMLASAKLDHPKVQSIIFHMTLLLTTINPLVFISLNPQLSGKFREMRLILKQTVFGTSASKPSKKGEQDQNQKKTYANTLAKIKSADRTLQTVTDGMMTPIIKNEPTSPREYLSPLVTLDKL